MAKEKEVSEVQELTKKERTAWANKNGIYPFFIGEKIEGSKRFLFYVTTINCMTNKKLNSRKVRFTIFWGKEKVYFDVYLDLPEKNFKPTKKYIDWANENHMDMSVYLIKRYCKEATELHNNIMRTD